jgi:phosphoribosylformylglycinamidine synthase subunit PurQ / glutaminase
MKDVKVIVLRTAGTNCDRETVFAFQAAGAQVDLIHINQIARGRTKLDRYQILALPGGFSYGDDISAGKVLANELINKIAAPVDKFIADGKLVIGICNGFQVLVKTGFLPGFKACPGTSGITKQQVTVFDNDSGHFECRWIWLKSVENSPCVFTAGIEGVIHLPIAHGEGKVIFENDKTKLKVRENRQMVFQYVDKDGNPGPYPVNPNGSEDDIAGLCNATGRVFGLMPHPERHILPTQHPRWTRGEADCPGHGMKIFTNAVEFARREL